MNENWVMLCIEVLLIDFGKAMTDVRGGDAWSVAGISIDTPNPIDPDLIWSVDVRSWSGPADPQVRRSSSGGKASADPFPPARPYSVWHIFMLPPAQVAGRAVSHSPSAAQSAIPTRPVSLSFRRAH
jgi:hypothetical protein